MTKKRFLLALALMLTAVGGAWAQGNTTPVTPVTGQANQWSLTVPAGNVTLTVDYYGQYTLDSIPLDWQVKVGNAAPVHPTAYTEGNTTLGYLNITETDSVELIPPAELRETIKSVTLVEPVAAVPVTAITLNKNATTIYKVNDNSTETLSVTAITPDEATDKTYTWSSDDITKATVDQNGVVTAVAAGTAHIRATANDGSGVYGECTVTVTDLSAYYSNMVECGCDDLTGKCYNGGSDTFTGQVLSAAQAIALAQAKAAATGSNCAVFYGGSMGEVTFAKNDGTTGSAQFYYIAAHKGLTGYRGYYVSQ